MVMVFDRADSKIIRSLPCDGAQTERVNPPSTRMFWPVM